jgi:hypoxia up-regulated 1
MADRHFPLIPAYTFNESESSGRCHLTVDGGIDPSSSSSSYTPEELVAMMLRHAVDIAVVHATAQGSATISVVTPPRDVVLTVPMFSTQRERLALLDAAQLAQLNVLQLVEETTAAALQYATDKTFVGVGGGTTAKRATNETKSDDTNNNSGEELVLFYNMGATAVQVALVRFESQLVPQKYGKPKPVPTMTVLAKAWDETAGGLALDHLIVEHLADEFNAMYHKERTTTNNEATTLDVRTIPRAMIKLRLQANKIKHVLSANADVPIYMDSLHDNLSLQTVMTRAQLEHMARPLLQRAVQPVSRALATANLTWANVTAIELVGGGMRVPSIQAMLQQSIQAAAGPSKKSSSTAVGLELGMHINADESMALGAAFCGANISTAFRVRHVGMTDLNPFGLVVSLENSVVLAEDATWNKRAAIFKPWTKFGVKKTIAFTHDRDVVCALDYDADDDLLPVGTERELVRYTITGVSAFSLEMAEKGLGKPKVSLQFELNDSGIASLIKAEVAVEETYVVQEEIEIVDDEGDVKANETDDKSGTTAAANATKEEAKPAEETKSEGSEKKDDGKKEAAEKEVPKPKKTKLVEKVS